MTEKRQLVFGHFRVASQPDGTPMELGRGAMGVTYKAFDERLRIDVALKLIAPAQVDNPKAQTSFLREARAAARVHHSNVASVVYLNDTPGNFFYAMEFVEGQPLRDWMRGQRFVPAATAIALAVQIARGLEAIHEQHLVHRDLKPANVMLVKSPTTGGAVRQDSDPDGWKVKIIDFGLARVVSADGLGGVAATQTAGFHGTALYASPEQCEERTDLDGRSDFYSLGCILWEMLCGAPPFRARTHRALMNQHVSESVPLDRLAHVPPSLAAVVARLLIKDPVNRFPNAAALIKALERAREKIESGEEKAASPEDTTVDPAGVPASTSFRTPPHSSSAARSPSSATGGSRRDLFVAAAAVLALLLPGWLIFNGAKAGPEPARGPEKSAEKGVRAVAATKSIAVLPFANLSSDKDNEYFAEGVHEDVLTNLTKIRDLRVISRTSVQQFKDPKDRNLPEIARELGVGAILEGTVRRSGNRVKVTAKLIDPGTERSLWSESFDQELTDIFAIQSRIAIAIATALQANLAVGERSELTRPATANAAAYPLYLQARGLLAEASDSRNVDAAAAALRAAIEADPEFALAHAQLSILHTRMYFDWGSDRSAERLALALQSAETALRLQLSLPEAQLAMGVYYYRGLRDYQKALPYFQRVLAAMPGNSDALFEIAAMERRQGKWDAAVEKLERVAEMQPLDPLTQWNIANTYTYMRRYDDAWRILQRAFQRMPNHPVLNMAKAQLFLSWKGDLDPMRNDIATRPKSMPDADSYLLDKIKLLLYERKFDEALFTLRESNFALVEGATLYITREALQAEILTQAGRGDEAEPSWQRVADGLRPLVTARPKDARVRMAYAVALAGTGHDSVEALREARLAAAEMSVERDAFDGTYFQFQLALVYLRTGHLIEAAYIVQEQQKIPSIVYDAAYKLSPAWDALRGFINSNPTNP